MSFLILFQNRPEMHKAPILELIEVGAVVTLFLVSQARKHNQTAIEPKLNRLKSLINLSTPATCCMREPEYPPRFCVNYCTHQALCSASPDREDVMTGEIRFLFRRFAQPRTKHHVITL